MFDALLPVRMMQSSSEMAMSQFNAYLGLWATAANQATSAWYNAVVAVNPKTKLSTARSWYRHPDEPVWPGPSRMWSAAQFEATRAMLEAFYGAARSGSVMKPTAFGYPQPELTSLPMLSWMKAFSNPVQGQAWPIAFFFIAAGMPASAAWPTAEASAHALEATRKAAEGAREMFATYRSDGGHATSLVLMPHRIH